MPLYETVSLDEFNKLRMPDQTRLYNMLSRNNGSSTGESGDDNFFAKRAKSLENAFGTTGAAIAGGINEEIERNKNKERGERFDKSMQDIYKNAGYNSVDDYYNAKEAAEKDAFGRIGFDIDSYWDNRANADIAGDKDTVARLDQEYNAAKAQIGNDEALAKFDEIQNQLKTQSTANYNEAKKAAEDYADYRQNSYIGQKTNQDRGKFAGSAINTLSTMFDVMAPGAGVVANSVQGGLEGIADELEQNGLKDFNWERAGQNALIGATTGAVTGGLNKGLNKIASTTGNILPGTGIASKVGNAGINATRAALNYAPIKSNGLAGQLANNVAQGALRGAASGAVGGATGAGLSAAMNGQDVLGSALEGAKRGAGQGALAGGVMAGANTAVNAAKNAMNGVPTNGVQDAEVVNNMPVEEKRKLLYHGSPSTDIEDFDMNMAGKNSRTGEKAIYFTDDLPTAEEFSYERIPTDSNFVDQKGAKGKVYRRYLDMQNPLDLSKLSDSQIESLWEYAEPRAASLMDKNKFIDTLKEARAAGNDQMIKSQLDLGRLPEAGYDGIIAKMYPGENDIREYGVFDSSKILKPEPNNTKLGLSPAFEPNDTIQTRNKWQSVGEQLNNAAKKQKYAGLYGSLDDSTAQRAIDTGVVDKLESLGVKPENYLEAAKTSDYINNLTTKLAENSEVIAKAPNLMKDLSLDNVDILMNDTAKNKYNQYINQIVADGPRTGRANSTPDEYSAGYLLKKSREFGKAAEKVRRSGGEGAAQLSEALRNAKHILRNTAGEALANEEITGNLTNDQIKQGLAKLGANEKIQNYYTELVDGQAPKVGDYIKRSADFEQARDMGTQMEAGRYSKNGQNNSPNMTTQLWNASGLAEPTKVVLSNTVAPLASGATKLAGKIIGGVGDAAAKIKDVLGGGDTPTPTTTNIPTNAVETAYNPATKVYEAIGRTEGLSNAEQARTADYLVNATQEAKNAQVGGNTLESLIGQPATTNNTSVYGSMYGTGGNTGTSTNRIVSQSGNEYFQPTGDYWTDVIARAMTAAIDADDVNAFASLYGMYQDSLSNLQKQQQSSTKQTKLTSTQQRANAAMDSLDRLSNMNPDLGYNLSGIPVIGNIATLGGNDYEGEAKSLAQQIGYMVSGANIKEEEAYNIGKAYVPQPFDSEQTRNLKLQRAYNIIRQYQNGTEEE